MRKDAKLDSKEVGTVSGGTKVTVTEGKEVTKPDGTKIMRVKIKKPKGWVSSANFPPPAGMGGGGGGGGGAEKGGATAEGAEAEAVEEEKKGPDLADLSKQTRVPPHKLDPDTGMKMPTGWRHKLDENTGRVYYYHKDTKQVSWVRPWLDGDDGDGAGAGT